LVFRLVRTHLRGFLWLVIINFPFLIYILTIFLLVQK